MPSTTSIHKDVFQQSGVNSQDSIQHTLSKEYGIDISEYQRHLEELNSNGQDAHFVDEKFPPTRESLCQNWEEMTEESTKRSWAEIEWKRPKQFMGDESSITLFDLIEPNDIKQGLLGDCYFLCSLSSLAERPHLIKRLFETKTYQKNGLYSIWLNIDGEWKNIIVDDFIPCKRNKPAFSRANGNELWVMLLEKAYAKAYGSYYRIEGGNPAIALRDLTGAPYCNFDEKDPDQMFNFLFQHDKNGQGDILTCYTAATLVREEQSNVGLYAGHAYSILDVKEISTRSGQRVRLIQIRNPWGNGEWNGAWSDKSQLWDDYTKRQVSFSSADDGSFFMCIEDFVQYFEGVGACQVIDQSIYNSISFKLSGQQSQSIVKIVLQQKTSHIYVTLNQRDTRFYTEDKYRYSFITMLMVRKDTNQLSWVGGCFEYDRNICIEAQSLYEGEYLLIIEAQWCQDLYKNLVVSCYSDVETNLSYISEGLDFNQIQQYAMKLYCREMSKLPAGTSKVKTNSYNSDQIGRMNGSDLGMVFFYFFNTSWNTTIVQTINFTKLTGYSLPLNYTNREEIKVVLPPQKEQMLLLKFNAISDFKTEYSFKSSLQMLNKETCKEPINETVYLKPLQFDQVKEVQNIEAKDRKLAHTNFKLGLDQIDQTESAVTVFPFEIYAINVLSSLVAPFIVDWPTYLFRLTSFYGCLLVLFSSDNCNFMDMILIMVCFIFFSAQVSTRKRMRKILIAFFVSTVSSIAWQIIFPQKWNSVDSQMNKLGSGWKYIIPLMQILFIIIKAYLTLIYWKVFVCYDELIHEVYSRFSDSKKEILI